MLLVISAAFSGVALYFVTHNDAFAGALFAFMAVVTWPILGPTKGMHPSGRQDGIPYFLDWDGHRHYFRADVHGYRATAPSERDIKEVIRKRLNQSIARHAVEGVLASL
jgi:hypothetical protein